MVRLHSVVLRGYQASKRRLWPTRVAFFLGLVLTYEAEVSRTLTRTTAYTAGGKSRLVGIGTKATKAKWGHTGGDGDVLNFIVVV